MIGDTCGWPQQLGDTSWQHVQSYFTPWVTSFTATTSRETYIGGLGNRVTHSELAALFDVIGTPTWADAEKVATPAWRHYLQVSLF